MQGFSHLSLESDTCGRTGGRSWVGVPAGTDRAQATPRDEIPLVPGWSTQQGAEPKGGVAEGIAPFYWGIWAGRDWSSWPWPCQLVAETASHPTDPGLQNRCPCPLSPGQPHPLALLWEGPVFPPAAEFPKLSLLSKHQLPLPCSVTTLVIGLFIVTLPSVLEPGEGHGAKYNSITS